MPAQCVAVGCGMRRKTNLMSEVKLHHFPAIPNRKNAWIKALKRPPDWTLPKTAKLCSHHFLTGAPSNDPKHPDWIPRLFQFTPPEEVKLAHEALLLFEKGKPDEAYRVLHPGCLPAVSNKSKVVFRPILPSPIPPPLVPIQIKDPLSSVDPSLSSDPLSIDPSASRDPLSIDPDPTKDLSSIPFVSVKQEKDSNSVPNNSTSKIGSSKPIENCQPTVLSNSVKFEVNSNDINDYLTIAMLKEKITFLENELSWFKKDKGYICDLKSDKHIKYLTGLPNAAMFHDLLKVIVDKYPLDNCDTDSSTLSFEHQFLLTLMRLKLGCTGEDLAIRFNISNYNVSTIFYTWLNALAIDWKNLIVWPSRETTNAQSSVRKKETKSMVRVHFHFSELVVDRPLFVDARVANNCKFKSHNTTKFLVGIAPNGTVCFISNLYCGTTSDKEITEDSKILEHVEKGDIVLAHSELDIVECLEEKGAELFCTKGKNKTILAKKHKSFRDDDIVGNIELTLSRLSDFKILVNSIPMRLLEKRMDTNLCNFDKILTVCAAIINMPLIAGKKNKSEKKIESEKKIKSEKKI